MSIIKYHKKYKKPRKPFEKDRIEAENIIVKKYGLKNKRAIWKAQNYIDKIRNQAKKLLTASQEEQQKFIDKLAKIGLLSAKSKLDDVLELKKENILDRMLQTIVLKNKLAKTPKHARQLITHRHILVEGKIVSIPSYVITIEMEKEVNKR